MWTSVTLPIPPQKLHLVIEAVRMEPQTERRPLQRFNWRAPAASTQSTLNSARPVVCESASAGGRGEWRGRLWDVAQFMSCGLHRRMPCPGRVAARGYGAPIGAPVRDGHQGAAR
jgi:hypothetical protein